MSRSSDLALRYGALCLVTHALFISLALMPGARGEPLVSGDAVTYLVPAQNLISNGAFSREQSPPFVWEPYRTPGYPLLIALMLLATGRAHLTLYIAALTAAVAGYAVVTLVRRFHGNGMAQHIAGVALTLSPNSLGLSAMLLTDAIFGHLVLVWVCLVYVGVSVGSWLALGLSVILLSALQLIKPTLSIAAVLIVGIGLIAQRSRRAFVVVPLLTVCSFLTPAYLAWRNLGDHDVFATSLLAVETARNYLHAQYLSEQSGRTFADVRTRISQEDRRAAEQLAAPATFYGRLYLIQSAEVETFVRHHGVDALRLMLSETLRQAAAPEEFAFAIFLRETPTWLRVLGSAVTGLLWIGLVRGAWVLTRAGAWRLPALAFLVLAFFLVTGSVSRQVGARLRFPGELVVISCSAIGWSSARSALRQRAETRGRH